MSGGLYPTRVSVVCRGFDGGSDQYRLWHVTLDAIALGRELVVGMPVALGSCGNVCSCLGLFETIE